MRFDILSIFPEMFVSPFESSLLQKARQKGLIEIHLHDIRTFALDKHQMTDNEPYGGGGGMVMKVEPIAGALEAIMPFREGSLVALLTPQGEPFRQDIARELATYGRLVLICGHYEGIDERVRTHLVDRELSIGDYVLTGGEFAAMVVVDAVSRLVPGVLGNEDSAGQDSFSDHLLEYPQYTRPAEYRGWTVPSVLLSGHHKEIDVWRRRESLRRTLKRRPDLIRKASLTEDDLKILKRLETEQLDE
ncbi:MAG: tRNA (guanosine(37)-N1)-methyltransferase TrmD [Syntrophales bacterium]